MSEQTTNTRADKLTVGDHITDHHGVHEVVHILPFRDGDGTPMLALTLRPLSTGVPWVSRHDEGSEVRMATADEVRDWEIHGRRQTLVKTLGQLSDVIVDDKLSIGQLDGDLTLFLDDDDQLAAWAKALDTEVTGAWPRVRKELPGLSVKVYGRQPSRAEA